ncbi:DUF1836 domain-containing protein [Sinanaerobacter chloroacetimidivorans]|uniref:DUF1836 domain-containing protein n=1 Tax=Sinanaerobacter chloroacetimidivorans TaxID=2818044 RepID=A0A8J7W2I2_9FIRM|nr:DUF1836 domain-containing protein [Sinanaerobacter chloroacetimidivorans]MBR0599697.1 DUF1836 domain-containing protein [Sinanaerobacter chloroacetimidivorans]
MRYEEFIKRSIEDFVRKGMIPGEEFPDMEIYMDQAETFMNKELSVFKKSEKDKVITKTMIGNYVKHNMLPRPVNKKYSRDHLVLLSLIYYLKGTFQMDEIESLMKPLIDNYNSEFDDKINLMDLYEGILSVQEKERESMSLMTTEMIEKIKYCLKEKELSDDDNLELFMLIVNLSLKADAQKFLAQKLLHEYFVNPKQKK